MDTEIGNDQGAVNAGQVAREHAIKTVTVIVNGRPKHVTQLELSFLEVVRLAFPDAVINQTTAYTLTFKRGPTDRTEGSLVDGESVQLKNGMVFNVTATDKS